MYFDYDFSHSPQFQKDNPNIQIKIKKIFLALTPAFKKITHTPFMHLKDVLMHPEVPLSLNIRPFVVYSFVMLLLPIYNTGHLGLNSIWHFSSQLVLSCTTSCKLKLFPLSSLIWSIFIYFPIFLIVSLYLDLNH